MGALALWTLAFAPLPAIGGTGGVSVPDSSATDRAAAEKPISAGELSELNARYAQALTTELGLLTAIDELDTKLDDSQRRIQALAARRAEATDDMRAAEDERAAAETDLVHLRKVARARLRAIVRLRRTAGLRFAISARDHADSVIKQRVLAKLLDGDRERMKVYRRRVAALSIVTDKRNAALANLMALDADLHGEKAALERERHDLAALIKQIHRDPGYHRRANRGFDAANTAMAARIAALEQWQARRYEFALTRKRLMIPVNFSLVEVPFGPRRDETFGTTTFHRGIDIRPKYPDKTNWVRAVFWARVAFVGRLPGYGRTVILDHGQGWHSIYAHLDEVLIAQGDVLRSRQRLGTVGSSGSLKGRYLYLEIRENGEPRDPALWFN